MEITLIAVGKTSTDYVMEGIDNYLKRLKHYVPFRFVELPDIKKGASATESAQKQKEGQNILSQISQQDYVVLLDERGSQQTSVEFSKTIEKHQLSGRKRLVFVIGGPYGFSQEVYDRSNSLMSLSKMTFNHEMVRLFFIEQVYRACTILRGEPYHHA